MSKAVVKGSGTVGEEPAAGAVQGNQVAEHPLLNPVILKHVFEYIQPTGNLETLKCTRLVCSTWRNESLSWWRKNAVLKLVPERGLMEEVTSEGGINPSELLEEVQDPSSPYALLDKPFEKYKLKEMIISIPVELKESSPSNLFWNLVGSSVKHLILDGVNFTGIKEVKEFNSDLLEFLVKHVPNLEHLEIKNISVNGRKCNPNWSPMDEWMDPMSELSKFFLVWNPRMKFLHAELIHSKLLSLTVDNFSGFQLVNFPNLQHIVTKEVAIERNPEYSDPKTLLDLLLLSHTGPWTNSTVKTMDLMESPISLGTSISLLERVHFSCLQRLSICFKDCKRSPEFECLVLGKLLQAHSGTLQVLEVCSSFLLRADNRFPFGQMEALKELRLWGNVTSDLVFLRWMPNLQVLMMDLRGLNKRENLCNLLNWDVNCKPDIGYRYKVNDVTISEPELMGVELPNLEIVHINHEFTQEKLRKLGEYMPNVKVLETVLGSGSIDVICEKWPLLEKLVGLHGSSVSDADVIGENGKGVVHLKHLKSFHLNANCDEGQLTDVASSGFLGMTELTDLQVCVSPEFTKQVEQSLENRFQTVKIIRNYSGNDSHVNWECCHNKRYLTYLDNVKDYDEDYEEDV